MPHSQIDDGPALAQPLHGIAIQMQRLATKIFQRCSLAQTPGRGSCCDRSSRGAYFRPLVNRWEYDVVNFLGFVQLGCIVILLRRCL